MLRKSPRVGMSLFSEIKHVETHRRGAAHGPQGINAHSLSPFLGHVQGSEGRKEPDAIERMIIINFKR